MRRMKLATTLFSIVFVVACLSSGCGKKATTESTGKKPVLASIEPASGPAGGKVKATGSRFGASQGVGAVRFADEMADAVSWADRRIVFVVPELPEAVYSVVVLTEDGASKALQFKVEGQPQASSTAPAATAPSTTAPPSTTPKDETGGEDPAVTAYKASFGDTTGWTFSVRKVSAIDPDWKIVGAGKPGYQGQQGLMHLENGAWVVKFSGTWWEPSEVGAPSDMTPY